MHRQTIYPLTLNLLPVSHDDSDNACSHHTHTHIHTHSLSSVLLDEKIISYSHPMPDRTTKFCSVPSVNFQITVCTRSLIFNKISSVELWKKILSLSLVSCRTVQYFNIHYCNSNTFLERTANTCLYHRISRKYTKISNLVISITIILIPHKHQTS